MKIKMIVTDLDETLLRTDKTISERTIQTLCKCKENGIAVVLATARFWIAAEKYFEMLQPDYMITADGTMVHDAEKMVCSCGFDLEETNQMIRTIQEADAEAEIIAAVDKKVYWNSLHISESPKLNKAIFFDYRTPLKESSQKMVVTLAKKETAIQIAKKANCRLVSYRDEKLYGFIPKNAGKLQMIQQLAQKLNISMDEIIAFGDDENDIEMLKTCGLGVAVSNAIPEVQEIADEITLSNNEDGVAKFLEELLWT